MDRAPRPRDVGAPAGSATTGRLGSGQWTGLSRSAERRRLNLRQLGRTAGAYGSRATTQTGAGPRPAAVTTGGPEAAAERGGDGGTDGRRRAARPTADADRRRPAALPDRRAAGPGARCATPSWRPGGAPATATSPPTGSSMPYIRDVDLDTPLTRSAEPVLRQPARAAGRPAGQHHPHRPDRAGADPADRRPRARAAPRPACSSPPASATPRSSSGPTASARRWRSAGPTHVFGHEHYAENLEDLACAGVPIHHPISGRIVGAVDLTCWRKDAGALLLTLAKTTAEQIRQALLADAGARELELLQEYLRTCRRTAGIVFAVTDDIGDAQRPRPRRARPRRPGRPAGARAARPLASDRTAVRRWSTCPPGAAARMYCQPGGRRGRGAPAPSSTSSCGLPPEPRSAAAAGPRRGCRCPGLVGSEPAVAARLPGGGDGLPRRASGWRSAGRARRRQAGAAAGGAAAPPADPAVRGARRRRRRPAPRAGCVGARRPGRAAPQPGHPARRTRSTGRGCASSPRRSTARGARRGQPALGRASPVARRRRRP